MTGVVDTPVKAHSFCVQGGEDAGHMRGVF
jgi:hypothetical protein